MFMASWRFENREKTAVSDSVALFSGAGGNFFFSSLVARPPAGLWCGPNFHPNFFPRGAYQMLSAETKRTGPPPLCFVAGSRAVSPVLVPWRPGFRPLSLRAAAGWASAFRMVTNHQPESRTLAYTKNEHLLITKTNTTK